MGFFDKLFRKKTFDPDERRRLLLAHGRITDGMIIENEIDPNGNEVAVFAYTLNGVDFESSDILTAEQKSNSIKYAPGAKVGIRYDPRNQGNSTLE